MSLTCLLAPASVWRFKSHSSIMVALEDSGLIYKLPNWRVLVDSQWNMRCSHDFNSLQSGKPLFMFRPLRARLHLVPSVSEINCHMNACYFWGTFIVHMAGQRSSLLLSVARSGLTINIFDFVVDGRRTSQCPHVAR